MDEETLEAAACAILFLGEAALRTSAANLVTRAHNVAEAAEEAANADHQGESGARTKAISGLLEAAKELEEVESAGRTLAVSGLLGVATALQAALGVGLEMLGAAAGDLARQCAELRESTAALERVSRAAEKKEEQNRSAPWSLWRWRRWGRSRTSTGDLEDGLLSRSTTLQATATGIMEATRTAVDFLSNEPGRMTGNLLELADKIGLSAHRLAVPDQRLKVARDALQRTNSPSSQMDAVNGLEAAAMEVQEEARDQRIILQRPAVQLAAACQSYLKASDAMVTVQRAATERARTRETAPVTVQNVQPPQPGADPGPGRGDQRRSGWLAYALGGSLSLAPYLVSTNEAAPKSLALGYSERWNINLALSLWWSVVASGAICSSYARSWAEVFYGHFAARVGMYSINIFVIYFLYWMLGIDDAGIRRWCFGIATGLHVIFLVVACWRRDP